MNRSKNHHKKRVAQENRFEFGTNWMRFLPILNESRILQAENSLKQMLEIEDLNGKSFLDIGSGSGLFSLAARRLGAEVYSFDYDPSSVACTLELKRRYFSDDENWTIEQGDVLEADYLHSFRQFDVVYSWGVLHHTGAMWQALANVVPLVTQEGKLAISIYNDQGKTSLRWAKLKKFYNQSSGPVRMSIVLAVGAFRFFSLALNRLTKFQNPLPFKEWAESKKERGMSVWHDLVVMSSCFFEKIRGKHEGFNGHFAVSSNNWWRRETGKTPSKEID
jgi:2-polyprenyl-3-methyl-5-hydroxy-6-metoxy-1,4-benzoquinol methylase